MYFDEVIYPDQLSPLSFCIVREYNWADNRKNQQKRTFDWLKNREAQGQLNGFWLLNR